MLSLCLIAATLGAATLIAPGIAAATTAALTIGTVFSFFYNRQRGLSKTTNEISNIAHNIEEEENAVNPR